MKSEDEEEFTLALPAVRSYVLDQKNDAKAFLMRNDLQNKTYGAQTILCNVWLTTVQLFNTIIALNLRLCLAF